MGIIMPVCSHPPGGDARGLWPSLRPNMSTAKTERRPCVPTREKEREHARVASPRCPRNMSAGRSSTKPRHAPLYSDGVRTWTRNACVSLARAKPSLQKPPEHHHGTDHAN